MDDTGKWVVLSKQVNPDSFYVKVDGADHYEAYWAVNAPSREEATSLATEVAEELVLGETEIISVDKYDPENISDAEIRQRIAEKFGSLGEDDDIQLAAWVSPKGGLW